jgi:rSAM/selenodomain-associated transferase 2
MTETMKHEPASRPQLSIIIPALNEAHAIGATLDSVAQVRGAIETIVVDGGSVDNTARIALERGARVIKSERGRGAQMHAGACVALGEALWFLHADTCPPVESAALIVEALKEAEVVGGNFDVRFDGTRHAARFLTWLYPRLRKLGLCYGDSAVFVRREAYHHAGGFEPFPIFEDLDLIRKLRRRGRIVHLPATVITSSRRFEERNFALTFARWSVLQGLYWLGVHPRTLGRLYAPIRGAR